MYKINLEAIKNAGQKRNKNDFLFKIKTSWKTEEIAASEKLQEIDKLTKVIQNSIDEKRSLSNGYHYIGDIAKMKEFSTKEIKEAEIKERFKELPAEKQKEKFNDFKEMQEAVKHFLNIYENDKDFYSIGKNNIMILKDFLLNLIELKVA